MTAVNSRSSAADATTTRTHRDSAASAPQSSADPGVTLGRVAHSELIKLFTIRSTYYALLATVLSIVGIGAFAAVGIIVEDTPPGPGATVDPTGGALTGVSLAVYLIAALGVLTVTGEYGTGTIKGTLAAVPKRPTLVAGKLLAVGTTTLLVTLAASVTAFFTARTVLSTDGMSISLTAPGVLRAVTGAALYLTAVALLASGLAWLLRSTAGSLATLFGILIVLPVAAYLLPARIRDDVMAYLPDSAGMAILQTTPSPAQLPPWTGFTVFMVYTAITLLAATLVLRRRDA
jgi:ABC-type transport system involved in multi-copper enzyme maturation permease subunit